MVDRRRRRLRSTALAGGGGARLPRTGLLSYNPNAYPFVDTVGANTRTIQPSRYILGDGTGYFTHASLTAACSIVTKSGTATPSFATAGRMTLANAATLWSFSILWADAVTTQYEFATLTSATSAIAFDVSGNGRHLTATSFVDASAMAASDATGVIGSDWCNLSGYSAGGLGFELIQDTGFDNTGYWSKNANCTISGSKGRFAAAGSTSGFNTGILRIGGLYRLAYTIDSISSGGVMSSAGSSWNGTTRTVAGTYTQDLVCSGSVAAFFVSIGTTTAIIDNASAKEIYPTTALIPARIDNPALDALGNALQYPGRGKYNLLPRQAVCATLAAGTSIAIAGVTGATILSKEGTGTVTIGSNVITRATDGTLYNLKLTLTNGRVLTLPLAEGSGTSTFAYDSTGQTYTGTITAADINAFWAGKQDTYFHGLEYGYRLSGAVQIPANPYTGLACDGNALTSPKGFNSSALYALPSAPELINVLGLSSDWYDGSGVGINKTLAQLQTLGVGPRFYHGTKGEAIYSSDQTTTDAKIKKYLKVT